MAGFILYLLIIVVVLYVVLALGVDLIARFAPLHRKPVLNAALLILLWVVFVCVAAIRFISSPV